MKQLANSLGMVVVLSLALALTHASGAEAPADKGDLTARKGERIAFDALDANSDGKLSLEELKAELPNFPAERFKARDADSDGFLTREEFRMQGRPGREENRREKPTINAERPDLNALFHRADKDGDGRVTLEEIQAIAPKFSAERFQQMDKDGDGALTRSEAPGRPDQRPSAEMMGAVGLFSRADKDGDGRLSYAELTAIAPNISKERFDQFDADKDGVLTRKEIPAAAAGASRTPAQLFKQADTDKDGRVSFSDLAAVAPNLTRDRFDQLDRNKDGVLTEDEGPMRQGGDESQSVVVLARKADADNDGKVSFEEMSRVAPNLTRERFDELDKNGDGVLSEADRAQSEKNARQGASQAALKALESDSDGDGKVTFEELNAAKPGYPRETFDRLDRNKDGVLSAEDARKS
ncbi:MAG: hypothetical protein AMXMBFR4_23440 [Candidatus Hydrogenedentota bacterium]